IDAVDATSVGGVRVANCQLARVILRLPDALGEFLIQRFGLDDAQLGVAILENIIRAERLPTPPVPFDAARGDEVFAPDAAALDDAPARRFQRGINVLGPGFGF